MRALATALLLIAVTVLAGCNGGSYSGSRGSCLPVNVPATDAVIYGHVTAQGGGALAGATVYVEIAGGQRISDATDAAGCYLLTVVAGAYAVFCEKLGYAKRTAQSGSVSLGASARVDFDMPPA